MRKGSSTGGGAEPNMPAMTSFFIVDDVTANVLKIFEDRTTQ